MGDTPEVLVSHGWDPGGSPRLFCAQVGSATEAMLSNVFIGEGPWRGPTPSPTPPSVALGTGDFSIEWWSKWKFGISPGFDLNFYSFFLTDTGGLAREGAACRWLTSAPNFDFRISGVGNVLNVTGGVQGVWSHHCANVDRDGNLEILVNNASVGSTNIAPNAAVDIGTLNFYPLIFESQVKLGLNQNFDDGPNDWDNNTVSPIVLGPVAVHNRLMTAAEREASRQGRTVQDFGSAVTQLRYSWDVFGETNWDVNIAHMLNSFRVGASTPLGTPAGTQGSVFVRDLSGNTRHYELPVAATYTPGTTSPFSADPKVSVAFGTDSFFA